MSPEKFTPEELQRLRTLLEEQQTGASPAEELTPAKHTTRARRPWWRNKVILLLMAIGAVVGLAALYVFVLEPFIALKAAENELDHGKSKAAVTVANSEILPFTAPDDSAVLPGANPKQLALGKDGQITTPSYFEFSSEKSSASSHVLDLYIDFYSQRSRDLIALNQATFESFIGTGDIILRVHPVLDSAGFSVFAPEALAEVSGTHPELAWSFFVSLMKNSDALLNNASTESASAPTSEDIVNFIASISEQVGVPTGSPNGVDADSIKYLSFFSWLYAGRDDEKLLVGYYPPVLYIDGEEVDQELWVLTDPDSLLKLLSRL